MTRIAPSDQRGEVSAAFYVCIYLGIALPVIGIGIPPDLTTLFTAVTTLAVVTGACALTVAAWHLRAVMPMPPRRPAIGPTTPGALSPSWNEQGHDKHYRVMTDHGRSVRRAGGSCTVLAEPGDEQVPARVEAVRRLQGRALGVVGDPVDVRSAGQQQLGRPALPAVAGLPEGVVDLARRRRRILVQELAGCG